MSLSIIIWLLNNFVFGSWPIAINIPSALILEILPSLTLLINASVTNKGDSFPTTSWRVWFQIISIFLLLNNFSCKIFSALSLSLLCINVTFDAKFVRNRASSTAVFPPPITNTSLFL